MQSTDDATGGEPGESSWSALRLRVPETLGEELLARFSDSSLGTWATGDSGSRAILRIYFNSTAEAESARGEAVRAIECAGIDPARCELTVLDVPDECWPERYQAGLRPFPFAGRFVVCPSGQSPPAGERLPIRLVPGRAFGTGEHPTTRLSAELLERRVRPGESWVDLGCGSGILSLVALACGAGEVLAVDVDPEAVEVACGVLEANGAAHRVELRQGSTGDLPDARDGIVANILASFFVEQGPALARLLRPGGTLVASGFDTKQVEEVEQALSRAGLVAVERVGREHWRAVAFRRFEDGTG